MIRAKWLVMAIAIGGGLTSCSPKSHTFVCDYEERTAQSDTPNTARERAAQSDTIGISIKIDGSGSMSGYVGNPNSRYIKTLQYLEKTESNAFSSLRPKTKFSYYRSSNLIDRDRFRKAGLGYFYDGSKPSEFKGISIPVKDLITPPETSDTLLTVVTDLDEVEGDITLLLKKIKQTYLNINKSQNGYAVAVWGIRSEFKGDVYVQRRIGIDKFPFPSPETEDKTRPFYILFFGQHQDINTFFKNLAQDNQNKYLLENSQISIFSPTNVVQNPAYLDKNPEIESSNSLMQKEWTLNHKKMIEVQAKDNRSQLWEIPFGKTEPETISDAVELSTLDYTLPLNTNSISVKPTVKVYNGFEKKFQDSSSFLSNDSSLKVALDLSNWKISKTESKQLDFNTTIDPNKLLEPGIYLYTFDIVLNEFQEQDWWDDWSWQGNIDSIPDGSKTHNLSSFLVGLKNMTNNLMKGKPPVIGHFCYGILKN